MRIGTNELLIILAVALLIFGPKNTESSIYQKRQGKNHLYQSGI